ncbi:MAG: NAD+ diphosphatase [Actinobacteria bacterium]|nr:NAD+ diphosphatase [Actinomycetota bacterium]
MSARNQSLSPIDRSSDLRLDSAKLALLWQSAQILPLIEGHIGANDGQLRFLTAEDVDSQSTDFEIGERYFLGLARDGGQAFKFE